MAARPKKSQCRLIRHVLFLTLSLIARNWRSKPDQPQRSEKTALTAKESACCLRVGHLAGTPVYSQLS